MKKLLTLFALLVVCACASAQSYGRYQDCQLQTQFGQAVAGASVYFLTQPANTTTLTPLASVYSSSTGGAITNPVTTNGQGQCAAYLNPGVYTVVYSSPITGNIVLPDQNIAIGGGGGGGGTVDAGTTNQVAVYPSNGTTVEGSSSLNLSGTVEAEGLVSNDASIQALQTNQASESSNFGSPLLETIGTFWNGSGSSNNYWTIQDVLGTGTNPSSTLTFETDGTPGASTVSFPNVTARNLAGSGTQCLEATNTGEIESSGSGACGSGSGGSTVSVNGTSLTTPNFNGGTPTAPSGDENVTFQVSGSDVSAYIPTPVGTVPTDATLYFTGTSINDDDQEVQQPTITLTGWTTSGPITTLTNSGTNGLHVGDWVNLRYAQSPDPWPACTSPLLIGTGCTLFQVLSSGLSSTQFEINTASGGGGGWLATAPGTCSSTCGTADSAMNNLPFITAEQPGMPGTANTIMQLSTDVTIRGLATNYTALVHPYSPAVTGKPGYLIINNFGNDAGICQTPSQIQTNYETVLEDAHTDGWIVVVGSGINTQFNQSLSCTSYYYNFNQTQALLYSMGKTASSTASGAYWDIFTDLGYVYNDPLNTNVGDISGGWRLGASAIVNSMVAGNGMPLSRLQWQYGTYQGSIPTAGNGYMLVPSQDSFATFQFLNAAMTYSILTLNTNGDDLELNGLTTIDGDTSGGSSPVTEIENKRSGYGLNSFIEMEAPNFSSYTPTTGTLYNNLDMQVFSTRTTNNGFTFGFNDNTLGDAGNAAFLNIIGDSLDSFHAITGGGFCIGVTTVLASSGQIGCPTADMFSVGEAGAFTVTSAGAMTAASVSSTASGCNSSDPYLEYNGSCGGGSGGGIANITITVASGSVAATCSGISYTSATMTGAVSTSTLTLTPDADVTTTSGWDNGDVYLAAYPSSGTLNWKVCTTNASGETLGANTTWNVSAK